MKNNTVMNKEKLNRISTLHPNSENERNISDVSSTNGENEGDMSNVSSTNGENGLLQN